MLPIYLILFWFARMVFILWWGDSKQFVVACSRLCGQVAVHILTILTVPKPVLRSICWRGLQQPMVLPEDPAGGATIPWESVQIHTQPHLEFYLVLDFYFETYGFPFFLPLIGFTRVNIVYFSNYFTGLYEVISNNNNDKE